MFGRNTGSSEPQVNGLQNPMPGTNHHTNQNTDHNGGYGDGPGTLTTRGRPPQENGMRPASASHANMSSVISNDLTIIGQSITIVSQGHVQIDGAVQGNVHGKEVSIGPRGAISGTVMAESVEVHGQLQGSIRSPSVTLHSTARVEGDIHHLKLAISEGAEFDGRVRRPKDVSELQPILDPAKLAADSGMPAPATPADTPPQHPAAQVASAQRQPAQPPMSVPTPSSGATAPMVAASGSKF